MIENYPSQKVKKFGERVASAIYDATVQVGLHGLGGCKEFDLSNFDTDLHPYINAYLEGNNDSVAIMYAAMRTAEMKG